MKMVDFYTQRTSSCSSVRQQDPEQVALRAFLLALTVTLTTGDSRVYFNLVFTGHFL